MIILGIDPGSTRIGYGVIESRGERLRHITSGLLDVPGTTRSDRLISLERSLLKLLAEVSPDRVGIERLFFARNKRTVLEVAHARGIIVATVAKHQVPLVELSPGEVKLAVTGDGNASKTGVARVVARLLALPPARRVDDVTDALAIAIAASGALAMHIQEGLTTERA